MSFELIQVDGHYGAMELAEEGKRLIAIGDNFTIAVNEPKEIAAMLLQEQLDRTCVTLGPHSMRNRDCKELHPGTHWHFFTSGTEGAPKEVRHEVNNILRVSSEFSSSASSRQVWSTFTIFTKMAGFQVLLECINRNCKLVVPPPEEGLVKQLQFLSEKGVTHLTATASQWAKIVSLGDTSLSLNQVTIGGEAASQALLDRLRLHYPLARISHIYATTETGTLFSVSDGLEGFPISKLKTARFPITISREGEIVVNVPVERGKTKLHRTGDIVEKRGSRYIFTGRSSEFISVGGVKVSPLEIERVIRSLEGVEDCVVYGLPNPFTGQIVCAEVRPHDQATFDKSEFRSSLQALLPRESRPGKIIVVDEIELSSSGKALRRK